MTMSIINGLAGVGIAVCWYAIGRMQYKRKIVSHVYRNYDTKTAENLLRDCNVAQNWRQYD